jgi:hypothetical protein
MPAPVIGPGASIGSPIWNVGAGNPKALRIVFGKFDRSFAAGLLFFSEGQATRENECQGKQ